jgi:hypothetical protein
MTMASAIADVAFSYNARSTAVDGIPGRHKINVCIFIVYKYLRRSHIYF